MPLYEFHCLKCDRDSEQLVRSSRWEGRVSCPHCGSVTLEKKFSTFASSVAGGTAPTPAAGPACSGVPSSCGLCGTGRAHSH